MTVFNYKSETYVCPECTRVYTKIMWNHDETSWNYSINKGLGLPQCIKCSALLNFVPKEGKDSNVKPLRVIRTGNTWVSPVGQAGEGWAISYERSDMKCPFCRSIKNEVVDSRLVKGKDVRRRRRECSECGRRFGTHEIYDDRTKKEVLQVAEERRKNAGV